MYVKLGFAPLAHCCASSLLCVLRLLTCTDGVVYRCLEIASGQIVAMKRIRLDDSEEGVPSTAIREISTLRECALLAESPNPPAGAECIVRLLDAVLEDRNRLALIVRRRIPKELTMKFEFLESDLRRFQDTVAEHVRAARLDAAVQARRAQRFEFAVRDDDDLDSDDSDEDMPLDEPTEFPMPGSSRITIEHHASDRALSQPLVASLTRQLVPAVASDPADRPGLGPALPPLPPLHPSRPQAGQPAHRRRRQAQDRRLWSRALLRRAAADVHARGARRRCALADAVDRHAVVSRARDPPRSALVRHGDRCVVARLYAG